MKYCKIISAVNQSVNMGRVETNICIHLTLNQIQHIVSPVHSAIKIYPKCIAEQFWSHGQSRRY